MISIAIKTAEREEDYLAETLENLRRGGVFNSPFLESLSIVDTEFSNIGRRVPAWALNKFRYDAPPEGRRTIHQNAQRAIEIAGSYALARYALVLEDDINVCNHFLESVFNWLIDHEDARNAMYVFGANYHQIKNAVASGETEWAYPTGAFYGAQACAWTRDDAKTLAEWLGSDPYYTNEQGEPCRHAGHDLKLGLEWSAWKGINYFKASAPSFVQHIGRRSGINNSFFEFDSWPGESWSYQSKVSEVR